MRVCVISEEESLGSRICGALAAAGQECPAGQSVRFDQAERFLARDRPELIVAATGRHADAAIAAVSRLRDMTTGHLLAVGPVSDPRLVLGILRGGAVDYVDETAVETELASALMRLTNGKGARAVPGRVCAIVGASGGSGSSLIAANLSVALAKLGERSLAIDLKSRCGDLAALMDLKPSHTMQDVCRVASRIDRTLLEQTLSKHASGASLLASPRRFDADFSGEALTRVMDLGRSMFSRVVVDVDPNLTDATLEALRSADATLVVLRLEFNALRNAKAMLDHMERHGFDPQKLHLVGNRVGQRKEIAAAKVEEALGRKFFATLPDDPKAALSSTNNGVPVVIEWPSSRLAKGLTAMATALNKLAPPAPSGVKS